MRWLGLAVVVAGCRATGAGSAGDRSPSIFQPAPGELRDPTAPAPSPGALLLRDGRPLPASEAGASVLAPVGEERLSLDVVDADLHDVLRLIGVAADLDFVVVGEVQARVTLRLEDVPWSHALAALLQRHGLAVVAAGPGVWRVVPASG